MENFKNELRQLLARYPQVRSVSFDITETIIAGIAVTQPQTALEHHNQNHMPPLGSISATSAVESAMASLKMKPNAAS